MQRPEWMIEPPKSKSLQETLQIDQKFALKSRGFLQSNNNNIESLSSSTSLWTELPNERQKRLANEQIGIPSNSNSNNSDSFKVKYEYERQRQDRIKEAIEEHNSKRGPSLLEQHQAKLKENEKKKKKKRKHYEEDDLEQRQKDEKNHRSSSRKEHRSHHDHHHHGRKHQNEEDDEDDQDEIYRKKIAKRKEKEKKSKISEPKAPTMIWDRDSALSAGSVLIGERKKNNLFKSANQLNDRFAKSSSGPVL